MLNILIFGNIAQWTEQCPKRRLWQRCEGTRDRKRSLRGDCDALTQCQLISKSRVLTFISPFQFTFHIALVKAMSRDSSYIVTSFIHYTIFIIHFSTPDVHKYLSMLNQSLECWCICRGQPHEPRNITYVCVYYIYVCVRVLVCVCM